MGFVKGQRHNNSALSDRNNTRPFSFSRGKPFSTLIVPAKIRNNGSTACRTKVVCSDDGGRSKRQANAWPTSFHERTKGERRSKGMDAGSAALGADLSQSRLRGHEEKQTRRVRRTGTYHHRHNQSDWGIPSNKAGAREKYDFGSTEGVAARTRRKRVANSQAPRIDNSIPVPVWFLVSDADVIASSCRQAAVFIGRAIGAHRARRPGYGGGYVQPWRARSLPEPLVCDSCRSGC
jgi:hypothetical protein